MRIIPSLLSALVIALACIAVSASAAEAGGEARIVKIVGSGSPTVTIGGQTTAAHEAMALPLNAIIQTSGQEVYIEVTTGVVATVKHDSRVKVESLDSAQSTLELSAGQLVTQIDKKRPHPKKYQVRVGQGVAAARGTSFTVSAGPEGLSITTTADAVDFTTSTGARVEVRAGMVSFTPPGAAEPLPAVPLATAVASNPEVAGILRDAVATAATVIGSNLGSIAPDSATSIVAQVVAVAAGALPTEAAAFTSQAIAAVTAPGAATGGMAATAAGAITAAAITAAPALAVQIAGAAAQAAPDQAGVITAVAQQVAPSGTKEAIAQGVAIATGQTGATVQSNADASAEQAASAVNLSKEATSNVVAPPAQPPSPSATTPGAEQQSATPGSPVDPTINASPAT